MIILRSLTTQVSKGTFKDRFSRNLSIQKGLCVLDLQRFSSKFAAAMSEGLKEIREKTQQDKADKSRNRYDIRRNKNKRAWEDDHRTPEEIAAKRASMNPEDKVKRKKSVVLMGYSGVNYFGMQRNPGQKTIEEDLFVAMFKNKWMTEESFNQAQYANFQRAARTDKGVSAARQICSIKLRRFSSNSNFYSI